MNIEDNEHSTKRLAHDLNSPIAVIRITLHNIKTILPEESYHMIESALNRMRSITNQALEKFNFTKHTPFNFSDLIAKILQEKQYEWLENPCSLLFRVTKKAKRILLVADEVELGRILSNLLNNAYESLNNRRNIFVSLKKIRNYLVLSIKDTGEGIPNKKIQAVLNGKSLKKNGQGIGLSSAVRHMQSIGGRLTLQSTQNQKTNVKLYFPILLPTISPRHAKPSSKIISG